MSALQTRTIESPDDIRAFFDALADSYREAHGSHAPLLRYRLRLIRRLLRESGRSCLVEIGCGNGLHLFPLSDQFARLIGTDLSEGMITAARATCASKRLKSRVQLNVDPAESLTSVPDAVADAVLCVGAFEHMQDQTRVLGQVNRILKPGGTFVCLSVNGASVWYTRLAPTFGFHTRHLSTDRFLSGAEWRVLLDGARFHALTVGYWRFVPAGDMPRWAAVFMRALDGVGAALGISSWRGGCYVKAVKR
jgi:2-polyprenyl-6-hydroxyphenyl methylase/3-demethylubiquinone-9 3-methyltransferase